MRVFLLSPASTRGQRARVLFNPQAGFELARRLRSRGGVMMGEAFSFLSGLYFRGKLQYALTFARPPRDVAGVLVITPSLGLRPPWQKVTLAGLRKSAQVPIDLREPRYTKPLLRDARALAAALLSYPECEVVLLGSIATGKYVELLSAVFGDRLRFPPTFVGRGDMSRGGLLLRCVAAGRELDYAPIAGAVRHGPRPPRLEPQPGILRRALGAGPAADRRQKG